MLETILNTKKQEIATLVMPESTKVERRSLYQAIKQPNRELGLIAEVKKASPSKGLIREDFQPVEIAKAYEAANADAISVLTDQQYFQGHRDFLTAIKKETNIPIMRKDFIIDEQQVEESFRIGADAILLIAGTVSDEELFQLYQSSHQKGMECLVEVHAASELSSLLTVFTPELIGINNRNLKTFSTSLAQTEDIAKLVPEGSLFVSESGIHGYEDVKRVQKAGAGAILVGESLMRAESPNLGIKHLFGELTHDSTS
ncbi:indole-3-glycerol phosphate synthase TrpC [Alkalicoccobacillus plakortidis]|uniref:Indole-3-glycerol phosphate synthase n=1 Tax=Alkalicoccobacillus plakortidis TaxID=444060 RepID=A0ABT0XEL9_9BACI|nr:indole-3-glycerol phosphate synthase TrpC [Alkalicoccobacillus plakortidis]MCM2674341.1 indole-3-glycerol phosphate synthase TrpC [Alkalicoccobacillus plakortidis]